MNFLTAIKSGKRFRIANSLSGNGWIEIKDNKFMYETGAEFYITPHAIVDFDWEIEQEKKEITLFRHTISDITDTWQTPWCTKKSSDITFPGLEVRILKTETKIVRIE